jgi:hypothetical protein
MALGVYNSRKRRDGINSGLKTHAQAVIGEFMMLRPS